MTGAAGFRAGRPVLAADADGALLVVRAASIDTDRLQRLEALAGAPARLALTPRRRADLGLPPGEAVSVALRHAGADRAYTMRRLAAAAAPAPAVLPGHVGVVEPEAALPEAAALAPVLGADGRRLTLAAARGRRELAGLPVLSPSPTVAAAA